MPVERDLEGAKLRRDLLAAGLSEEQIDKIREDKAHAKRLALLSASADARGAAPPPPGAGGKAPQPVKAASAPVAIIKYRATEDHEGEVNFSKGDTVFVVGDADASGNCKGVVNGKNGQVPKAKLVLVTPELLEKEKQERDAERERAAKQREAELQAEHEAKLKAAEEAEKQAASTPAAASSEAAVVTVAAVNKEFEAEKARLLEEENRIKAEAARLEEMLRALELDD